MQKPYSNSFNTINTIYCVAVANVTHARTSCMLLTFLYSILGFQYIHETLTALGQAFISNVWPKELSMYDKEESIFGQARESSVRAMYLLRTAGITLRSSFEPKQPNRTATWEWEWKWPWEENSNPNTYVYSAQASPIEAGIWYSGLQENWWCVMCHCSDLSLGEVLHGNPSLFLIRSPIAMLLGGPEYH